MTSESNKPSQAETITFDCYGTLIDWETGIRNAFRKALAKTGFAKIPKRRVFELYEMEERRVEKEEPYQTYRDVLSRTTLAVAKKAGWRLSETESSFLAKELSSWKPFPDTNPALKRLSKRHRLGILSNIDNDLLEQTLKHFPVPFDIIVTAQKVRSYKPRLAHFQHAERIIGKRNSWLHVAASQYHDIEPAVSQGIRAVWVNRMNVPSSHHWENVTEFKNLKELADWLGA